MTVLRFNWSATWPKEPGSYLFFGVPRHVELKRGALQAVDVRPDSTGRMIYLGTDILYPEEWRGVWAPLDVELPDLELLLSEDSG